MTTDVFLTFPEEITDPDLLERYDALMTEEERATEQRFVFPHDRHRHRVTRALVRSVLAEELGLTPSEIRFELNGYGRPELAAHHTSSGLSFNLSHTRDAIVLATSRDGVVGIDVEDHTRSGATLDIAEQFFSRPEVEALAAVAPADQRARFYQVWTLKEAYIKARGMGLSLPLDSFGFTLDTKGPLLWTDERSADERWRFFVFAPTPRHFVALAIGPLSATRAPEPLALRTFRMVPLVSREEIELPRVL